MCVHYILREILMKKHYCGVQFCNPSSDPQGKTVNNGFLLLQALRWKKIMDPLVE